MKRTTCEDCGVKQSKVPWARTGSGTNSLIQAAKDRARDFRSTKILVDFPVQEALDRQLQISITII